MPSYPLSPDVQGQAGVVGIRAELRVIETGNRSVETGRQQIDLAHLSRVAIANLDGRVVRGHPVRTPPPRRRSLRTALARPERQDHRGLGRQLVIPPSELEAASQHRVPDDPI